MPLCHTSLKACNSIQFVLRKDRSSELIKTKKSPNTKLRIHIGINSINRQRSLFARTFTCATALQLLLNEWKSKCTRNRDFLGELLDIMQKKLWSLLKKQNFISIHSTSCTLCKSVQYTHSSPVTLLSYNWERVYCHTPSTDTNYML